MDAAAGCWVASLILGRPRRGACVGRALGDDRARRRLPSRGRALAGLADADTPATRFKCLETRADDAYGVLIMAQMQIISIRILSPRVG